MYLLELDEQNETLQVILVRRKRPKGKMVFGQDGYGHSYKPHTPLPCPDLKPEENKLLYELTGVLANYLWKFAYSNKYLSSSTVKKE